MAKSKRTPGPRSGNSKLDQKQTDLNLDIQTGANEFMTTDQGLKIKMIKTR
jgi:hypothetical protein